MWTQRPLSWAISIEKFADTVPNVKCRWNYGISEDLVTECQVLFFFDTTKKVTINIYLRTGVFMICGNNFKEWANYVFPEIKKMLDIPGSEGVKEGNVNVVAENTVDNAEEKETAPDTKKTENYNLTRNEWEREEML